MTLERLDPSDKTDPKALSLWKLPVEDICRRRLWTEQVCVHRVVDDGYLFASDAGMQEVFSHAAGNGDERIGVVATMFVYTPGA